jgi:hypothetical protein
MVGLTDVKLLNAFITKVVPVLKHHAMKIAPAALTPPDEVDHRAGLDAVAKGKYPAPAGSQTPVF